MDLSTDTFSWNVPALEQELGLGFYASNTDGIGGDLRVVPEDFQVREDSAPAAQAEADGKYTLARVQARNWETNRLVRQIAKRMGLPERKIHFTGTKDKRAVTVQNMAIPASEERVLALDLGDVEILETRRVDRAPKLGEHTGNGFTVRIRRFDESLDAVAERAREIATTLRRQGGFPNFFGPQRFGSVRPTTHVVGRRLLEGDVEEAVWTYIALPSEEDPDHLQRTREELWETRDPEQARDALPRRFDYEHQMLDHLLDHPGDAAGALDQLPRTLTRLFVGAFQSFLFNQALVERSKRGHPQLATEGDRLAPADPDGLPLTDPEDLVPVRARNLDRCEEATRDALGFPTAALPGYDTPSAEGLQGEIEREVLERSGISSDDFRMPDLPHLAAAGTRRPMWCPLQDCQVDAGTDEHGDHVEVRFFLPKGSYATCLLREVMKAELSAYA